MSAHDTHCCPEHGCKYGDADCPVELGASDGIVCQECRYEDGEIAAVFVSKIRVVRDGRLWLVKLYTTLPDPLSDFEPEDSPPLTLTFNISEDDLKAYLKKHFRGIPVERA